MNQRPLLERRSPLGISYALLILVAFFFFLPSGFRAARLSLNQKENDVKDWLPSDSRRPRNWSGLLSTSRVKVSYWQPGQVVSVVTSV